jgi:hypothetical protein
LWKNRPFSVQISTYFVKWKKVAQKFAVLCKIWKNIF